MSESYLSRPFSRQSPSGFFSTPKLSQRLTLILHLINHSDCVLLVMGEKGYGKTTLMEKIIQQSKAHTDQAHWKLFHLSHESVSLASQKNLLTTLLSAFGEQIEGRQHVELINTLRGHVANTRYNAQLPVLIIDDAHMLPLETLHLLLKLAMTGDLSTRLRVLLFAEPQITSIFAAPEFEMVRNNLIHTLDIPPFNAQQTAAYIQLHASAIFEKNNPFSPEVMAQIYHESQGVPARINHIALALLKKKHGVLNEYTTLGGWLKKYPQVLKWFFGLLFFALVVFISYQLKNYLWQKPIENKPLSEEEIELEPVLQPPDDTQNSVVFQNPPLMDNPPEPETPIEKPVEPLQTPQPPPIETGNWHDITWLHQQPPEHYTIQILGSHEMARVNKFIAQYQLKQHLALFQTQYKNRTWFVLLYGNYPDRNTAIRAINNLPVDLRKATQPWTRSFASIHSEIKVIREK
jgi:DamX protein